MAHAERSTIEMDKWINTMQYNTIGTSEKPLTGQFMSC